MTKLFLSLYLAVTLGLLAISWSTDWLWQQLDQEQDSEQPLTYYKTLISAYADVWQQVELKNTEHTAEHSLNVKPVALSQYAFLPEQLAQLEAGEVVHLYQNEHQVLFFVKQANNNLLQFGPESLGTQDQEHKTGLQTALLFLSYLLLAAFIFFWSRPLWRDLTILQRQTERIAKGQNITDVNINKSSVIYPLAQCQKNMAEKIGKLITLQKQMTHAVSHDIRTPLARLKFSLAIADNNKQTESNVSSDMLKDIAEIEGLIDEMLTYGRLETDVNPVNLELVDVAELGKNLLEKLSLQRPELFKLQSTEKLAFYCDGHLLERALQNLLTNAERYAKQSVVLTLKLEKEQLTIRVSDDGPGIAAEDRNKIFTPFCRLESSRNKSSGGFGLGLAIVHKIVQWHNGSILLQASELGGAEFTITLPVKMD